MKIALIANPNAGSGRGAARLQAIAAALETRGVQPRILETTHRGHATHLALQVVAEYSGELDETLAVLGGDGTLSEVCQAYVDKRGQAVSGPALALVPSGTGGDTARGLGLVNDPTTVAEHLISGARQPMDLGCIRVKNDEGNSECRAFVNVSSVGLTSTVADRINKGPQWLGGTAAFYFGTLVGTLGYRNLPVSIEVDGNDWYRGPILLVAIANGKYFGGGMKIAPNADVSDGHFDVTCIGDISRAKLISLLPLVYSGRHLSVPEVKTTRARQLKIRTLRESSPSQRIEADGETPGKLPLDAHILPGALRFVMGEI